MILPRIRPIGRIRRAISHHVKTTLAIPPGLPKAYSIKDYADFMNEETWRFSARYARQRVIIHHPQHLTRLGNGVRAVIAFLHYGSFFLMGGALVHQLGLSYSAIASRRNALALDETRKNFWLGVYQRADWLYTNPLFYTDQSPRLALDWLNRPNHILGVAMDVREIGRSHVEHRLTFLDRQVHMQLGAARLASHAKVPLVPVIMHYCRSERRHHLHIESTIEPTDDPAAMTQRALDSLAPYVAHDPNQQFHDIASVFALPHSP